MINGVILHVSHYSYWDFFYEGPQENERCSNEVVENVS